MRPANKLRLWYVTLEPVNGVVAQVRKNTATSRIGVRPVDAETGVVCGNEVILNHGEYMKFYLAVRPLPEKEKTEVALKMCGYSPDSDDRHGTTAAL